MQNFGRRSRSGGLSNGPSFRRQMTGRNAEGTAGSPASPGTEPRIIVVMVQKDEHGYGMKVSGDNPVYVQSVKEGKRNNKWWLTPLRCRLEL